MVEGFGYEMFTGYMGSHSVVLSSILLEERQVESFIGRERGRDRGGETCPNGFGFAELTSEGYGLYCM